MSCDNRKTNPFTCELDGTVAGELMKRGYNEDVNLLLNSVISQSENPGTLRLYNDDVQAVIFQLIEKELLKRLKEKQKKHDDDQMKREKAKVVAELAAEAAKIVAEGA